MTETSKNLLIEMRDVVKAYRTGDGPFVALNDVNIDIQRGEFLGITGKSGAGKTTLLNMITGVSSLTSGEVIFHNGRGPKSIHNLGENELAQWRGENVGIVYQSFELIPSLSLVENVMLPPDFLGTYNPVITKTRALEILELVDILEHAYKIPAHISGGQKQRVAIARALVNDPALIIADEPTGNLDTVTAEKIFGIFESLVAEGKTIVMVTHDQCLASRFSRPMRMSEGGGPTASVNRAPAVVPARDRVAEQEIDQPLTKPADFPNGIGKKPGQKMIPAQDHPAISLQAVNKTYESPAGKFVALKSIDLELNYGQFISIVGKSGSGKSTLLNMITGIDFPTTGEVIVGNKRIYDLSESKRAMWRGRNMGVVFQFFQLLPTLTLLENTMLPMDYCGVYSFSERPRRAMELLEMVGLGDQAHKLPGSVSSGQQQSAAIARSLATDPAIILADEPTGNLDSRSAEVILKLFQDLADQGKTIIIVTHDPSITQRTDQTIILSDGEIINPTVARALPLLSHPQMLAATKKAGKQRINPGETIIQQGTTVNKFYMIEKGEVEILASTPSCQELNLARLGPGQFFGEVELTQDSQSIASVRAAGDTPVELSVLERDAFLDFLEKSSSTRVSFQEIAESRLKMNRDKSEKC